MALRTDLEEVVGAVPPPGRRPGGEGGVAADLCPRAGPLRRADSRLFGAPEKGGPPPKREPACSLNRPTKCMRWGLAIGYRPYYRLQV